MVPPTSTATDSTQYFETREQYQVLKHKLEILSKGKDMKEYSSQDYFDLDDHYQRLCNRQKEFVIWEGPVEGR